MQQVCSISYSYILLFTRDTAGQERFRTITSTYYRGTHGVIVVYDVTNVNTFKSIQRWLMEIDQYCSLVSKILVGNKCDDRSRKAVSTEEAKSLADSYGIKLVETSAKDDINVDGVFLDIARSMLKTKLQHQETEKKNYKVSHTTNIRLQNPLSKTNRRLALRKFC